MGSFSARTQREGKNFTKIIFCFKMHFSKTKHPNFKVTIYIRISVYNILSHSREITSGNKIKKQRMRKKNKGGINDYTPIIWQLNGHIQGMLTKL